MSHRLSRRAEFAKAMIEEIEELLAASKPSANCTRLHELLRRIRGVVERIEDLVAREGGEF